jgi:ribosome recycling factor
VLDDIRIDYYGQPTPIKQMCNVSIPEPRLIVIQPWDKTTLSGSRRRFWPPTSHHAR